MLKLSLIIPVYNEERHIEKCLDSVVAQTRMPFEVIVVDNNCTDKTREIVEKYRFVRLVSESKQGTGHARSKGFSVASGDVIGRIDADCELAPNWVEVVLRYFEHEPKLDGITGLAYAPYILGVSRFKNTFFSRFYYWFAHSGFNTITMWGSNMALRRSAWLHVKDKVFDDDKNVHEDQDISLWMAAQGSIIRQCNDMIVTVNAQGVRYLPKLFTYCLMYKHTKQVHQNNGNLTSKHLRRLGYFHTLPSRILAMLVWVAVTPFVILLFPIDFVIKKIWPKSWWID